MRRVKKHGIPDLAPTIKFGKLNAPAAETISQLPKNEQLKELKTAVAKGAKKLAIHQVRTAVRPCG